MTAGKTAMDSAKTYIVGVPGLIAAAIAAVQANNVTLEQLAPLVALGEQLKTKADETVAAIAANTPATP